MWRKNLAKIVIFCTILVILINGIYGVLSWKDTNGAYLSTTETLYAFEEDLVDVLFMGSSHCYCTVNNTKLWNDYGIASFNMSISGQDIASSYFCLVETLKTQTPEVVFIEACSATFGGYGVVGNLYRNTLSLRYSANFYEAVDSLVTDEAEKEAYWLKWPIVHTRYAELQKKDFQTDYPAYLGFNVDFETRAMEEIVLYTGDEMEPIPEESEKWLRKIIELTREKGIHLCLYISPCVVGEEEQKKFLYMEQLAQEEGVDFINTMKLKNELGLDMSRDFIDATHTNYYGAEKVTAYLGNYLKEQYTLEDRRGSAGYELWEAEAEVTQRKVQNHQLTEIQDVKAYLDMISVLDDYTVVIATNGAYQSQEVDIVDQLQGLGIGEEFFQAGGIWIYDDREQIYASQAADALYYTELSDADLAVSSVAGTNNIVIDKQSYIKMADSINIVVYDNQLGVIADNVAFYGLLQYLAIR